VAVRAKLVAATNGDALLMGFFVGALDLGLASGPLVGSGGFLAKVGPDGQASWALPVPCGASEYGYEGVAVRTDTAGNVYLWRSLDANEAWICGLPAADDPLADDTALVELAPDGTCVRAARMPFQPIAVDPAGQIAFVATDDQGGAVLGTLDADWNVLWAIPMPVKPSTATFAPGGDLLALGTFSGSIDLGNGPLWAAAYDVWVARYDATGAPVCRSRFGGPDDDIGGMSVDPLGNLLLWIGAPAVDGYDVQLLKYPLWP
jgi:hypothetical protein